MKTLTLIHVSRLTLPAVVVSLLILALVSLLQHPNLFVTLVTVSWNG